MIKVFICPQVIDYKRHPVLHSHLADHYSSHPFDAIIDMVGEDNSILKNSSAYLKPDGIFVFGGNMPLIHGGGSILDMIRWFIDIKIAQTMPLFLGGMPRKCLMHTGKISRGALLKLVGSVEEGKMRPVVDSVIDMDQVLQVWVLEPSLSSTSYADKLVTGLREACDISGSRESHCPCTGLAYPRERIQ